MTPATPKKPTTPKTPAGLCKTAGDFFRSIVGEYVLEDHHLRLLTEAAWMLHRAEEARKQIAKEGATVKDRFGQPKEHPSIAIERGSGLAYLRLRRELNLDVEPNEVRTPRRTAGRR